MDFALIAVRWFLLEHEAAQLVGPVWMAAAEVLSDEIRFAPAWTCSTCNEGDGWGKRPGWCGEPGVVHPVSFSMTLAEMRSLRGRPRGADRRRRAEGIWRDAALDHVERRFRIWTLARELVGASIDGVD